MTAPAELVIEVTADDIRLGERTHACRCPVARAVARATGGSIDEADVAAAAGKMNVTFPDGTFAEYALPQEVDAFMDAFDHGRPVAPFTFTARRIGGES